jgi:TetR/AcrR family acrAB operon transcriptional repressor
VRRTTYKKSEESQHRVLDAAIVVLAERGVTATSIQDIATEAGLSKGAVHYHFDNKEELLVQVLDRCCAIVEMRVRSVFEEPGLPMERVRRAIVEMWTLRRDGAPEFRVLAELHVLARQNATIREAFGAAYRQSRAQIVEIGFKRLLEMGVRPKVSTDVGARLLLATLDGLAMQHMVDPVETGDEAELLRALEATAIALFEVG